MKRICASLLCIFPVSLFALSGALQIKAEALYDTFRERYLTPLTISEQITKLEQIQDAITRYIQKPSLTRTQRNTVQYINHLLCQTESILTGYLCEDGYYEESSLTAKKDILSLFQLRKLLITEHNRRRTNRGLQTLKESDTLNTIAQSYAEELCKAGMISHTLNGSALSGRYDTGGYIYDGAGENLGMGQENIMELLDQLTTSIGHRKNMFEPLFEEIGVGQCDLIWVINYGIPAKE